MPKGNEIGKYYIQIVPTTDGISGQIEQELGKGEPGAQKAGEKAGSGFSSGFGKALKAVGAAVASVATVAGAALTRLTKDVISSFSEYEQLAGGVETLFKDSADVVKQYAENAFKSSGLSANQYMDTVTSFSASLITGLNGDTAKAAEIADVAIRDMSDNANKMGTSMESLQMAYAGFAKGNFTLLDNLKLGYGGSQGEMIRLINDSGILQEKIESLDGISFDQMISAIHVVQENLGIAGATAAEAEGTIEGSIKTAAAAWQNLVTGMGRSDADLSGLVDSFVESIGFVANNISVVLERALPAMVTGLKQLFDQLAPMVGPLITSLLPVFISAIFSLSDALTDALGTALEIAIVNLPGIVDAVLKVGQKIISILPTAIEKIAAVLPKLAPVLVSGAVSLISTLISNIGLIISPIIQMLPGLFGQILTAVTDNLPMLFSVITETASFLIDQLPALIGFLVDALPVLIPQIIQGCIMLLTGVFSHLSEILVPLIQMLPQVIMAINTALIDNLPLLLQGIVSLVGSVISQLPSILGALWDALKSAIRGAFETIGNLFKSLWETILKPALKWLLNGLIGILNKAIDGINVIIAPLRAIIYGVGALFGVNWSFDDVAIPHIPQLATGGILSEGRALVGEKGPELLEVYGGKAKVTPLSNTTNNAGGITINVYGAEGQDVRALAQAVNEELARQFDMQRAVFA